MSTRTSRDQQHRRAMRAMAESETQSNSGSDSEVDLVKASRKALDISQYIEALSNPQGSLKQQPQTEQQQTKKPFINNDTSETEDELPNESEWSEDDPREAYRVWKERKTAKRKRVAAETNRIRAQKKCKAANATSIVGRTPIEKEEKEKERTALSSDKEGEEAAFLDDPIPDYIVLRHKKLKKLHDAGLRYPPSYEDVEFSDSDSEQRPRLDKVAPQRKKKRIRLVNSRGIIPAPIAQWLRDYQVEGAEFLHEKFLRQTGAILGDDMGLGKTIQVIAFLTAAFGKTGTKRDGKCMRKIRRAGDNRWYPQVLIVCPGSLMQNWEDELKKWGWWEVYKYHGNNSADKKGVLNAATKGMLEIMITTYSTYRINESEINTIEWDCVIADECHTIKSKSSETTMTMNKVNALCRIGLTGTAIQNKYEELWTLLNWARPGAYGSAQEWKSNISLPLKLGQAHDATNAQLAESRSRAQELVHKILPGVFLRRMKKLIAHQLPTKIDRVVFCQLTNAQTDAYRTFLESDRCEYIRTAKETCDCGSGKPRGWCCYKEIPGEGEKWSKFMFPAMVTLQKIANHLSLIVPTSKDSEDNQRKGFENLQRACPDTYAELWKEGDKILPNREFCGKWKVLRRLLEFWHANGDKVLVFSHSVRLLKLLRSFFNYTGTKYNFSYLDGDTPVDERAKIVADYNADPNQFIFLISVRAGGVGLNITSANKVVVVDPSWNPAYDLQAQDRAYRIGQTRDVEVFRLVSSGTIEEIVYARQIYKQQQANIGYNASKERRYFRGVMDESSKKGELFGLENLFTFHETNLLLRDIMRQTNVAEARAARIEAADLAIADEDEADDALLSDKNLGIEDHIRELATHAKAIADDQVGQVPYRSPKSRDPIAAILAKAGVAYTHNNSEVIGHSEVEARLGRQAMELRHDIELGQSRVFKADGQGGFSDEDDSAEARAEADIVPPWVDRDGDDDASPAGTAPLRAIKYRYRPSEAVRRRLFAGLAASMGFDDVVEFALLVEASSQGERRKMLERFYRNRRRALERL